VVKLVDPDHPFFRKAWVRWATVLVPAAWAVFDGYLGNWGWAAAFAAIAAYALWILILIGPKGGGDPQP
jgi:hypothetical protein